MRFVDLNDVYVFHKKLIEKTGGSHGVRDEGLIQSAINRAFATFDGKELYEDIIDKIVVTTVSLVKNHGFIDGNKRIGIAVMLLLLKMNDIVLNYTQKELIDLGLGLAAGILNEDNVKQWIEIHKRNKA